MKKKIIFSIGLATSLLASSCIGRNNPQENLPASSDGLTAVTDTLDYHIEVFKEISPYFSGDGATLDTTYYAARFPVFSSEIDSLVRDVVFIDGEHNASQVAESFLGGFNEYAEEQIESENQAFHAWFRNQNCEVALNVRGFLTLKNAISEYTGGAHGIEIEVWSSYDIQNRKKLALNDLFQDTLALQQIVEGYFRKQEQLNDTSSYGSAYFFENETFTLADNFGVTPTGLLFHYNPYEIKSYAEGPTTLTIPYHALADVTTDTGKRLLEAISEHHK
ncbi:DUF3298 and DUF4163 domain-containing protein [Sphingobacterium sp. SGR-19]|uniref:DUF3298 and DUF4163 domain-containing protein n=1 Tax=Sphingobacterium sp. SGR-19 TaxID=2710886 RepID=UPI0013EE2C24|nr:DUF3298 and DUF4163 domain-containing protein [Sphingobacterium sp. SGR-19]NGM64012.1 DUF3298 and DUF4163 domain-containing protein [Sphingobacterium sp. SGR-19]